MGQIVRYEVQSHCNWTRTIVIGHRPFFFFLFIHKTNMTSRRRLFATAPTFGPASKLVHCVKCHCVMFAEDHGKDCMCVNCRFCTPCKVLVHEKHKKNGLAPFAYYRCCDCEGDYIGLDMTADGPCLFCWAYYPPSPPAQRRYNRAFFYGREGEGEDRVGIMEYWNDE